MLLSSANPPLHGEIVEVFVGNQVVVGQVRWTRGNQFGVKLGDRINAKALAEGRGGPIRAAAPVAAAEAVYEEEPEQAGIAYNFIFFAAAAVASVGFLLVALNKWLG